MSFRIAQKVALKSPHPQHRMGAVIVKGNRILSTGYNEFRYSKYIKTPTLHAEASAILKLLRESRFNDLVGSELYVTRWTPGGRIGLAAPCRSCMELIRSVGIRRVAFSDSEDSNGELIL